MQLIAVILGLFQLTRLLSLKHTRFQRYAWLTDNYEAIRISRIHSDFGKQELGAIQKLRNAWGRGLAKTLLGGGGSMKL